LAKVQTNIYPKCGCGFLHVPTESFKAKGAATIGPAAHEILLGEEEISDVTSATFYVFDKENPRILGLQRAGHGGGGGCAHAIVDADDARVS